MTSVEERRRRIDGRPTAPVTYRTGLDGLRAVAVALVVAFHLGGLPGGNLGVDAFFVISGWLITWRLLAEHDRQGTIGLRHFWGARARRLMPASLCVIGLVVVVWSLAGIEVASLRRDALFATFWASNWGTITGGGDYWARFGEVSPLTHFWSLAIEEQFYVVWPLVVVGVAALATRRGATVRHAVAGAALIGAIGSVVFMVTTFDPADRTATYMNTFARAHALLIGAAVGAWTVERNGSLRGAGTARRLAPLGGLVAVAVVLTSSEHSDWLFTWGFPVFALAMAVVVVAVADGAANRVFAARPMRWVGDRSYAIYLWHWPVIVLLDQARLDLSGAALAAVRLAVSLLLADVTYRWIEQPIRQRRRLVAWRAPLTAVATVAAVVAATVSLVPAPRSSAALVLTIAPPPATAATTTTTPTTTPSTAPSTAPSTTRPPNTSTDVAAVAPVLEPTDTTAPASTAPASTAPPSTAPPSTAVFVASPVRVLVAGDSTAVHLTEAMVPYAAEHPSELLVGSAAFPGCGLSAVDDGRLHEMTDTDGTERWIDLSPCVSEWDSVARRVSQEGYEVVLVSIGPWDGTDIRLADGRVVSVLDDEGSTILRRAYTAFVGKVESAGAQVVWVTPPDVDLEWQRIDSPMDDPARWATVRSIVDSLPVEQIDLPAWLDSTGYVGEIGRPDGVHLATDVADAFVAQAIAPLLLSLRR